MEPAALAELARGNEGLALSLVITVLVAGFRHGFDIDHVAAISDIASASSNRKTSLWLATMYALGHTIVVFALGVAAVFAGNSIPDSWDAVAGRLIGLSLIWLGVYVVYSVIRYRHDFRMPSRWMLLVAGARRGLTWMRPPREVVIEHEHEHPAEGHHHSGHGHDPAPLLLGEPQVAAVVTHTTTTTHAHPHKHVVPMPADPFTEYSSKTSFAIGMLHGVGAETPTQILLFTTAAGLAGALGGIALVCLFVTGLLAGNTVLAIVAATGLSSGRRLPLLYLSLATGTALISIVVGSAYLFEGAGLLPG